MVLHTSVVYVLAQVLNRVHTKGASRHAYYIGIHTHIAAYRIESVVQHVCVTLGDFDWCIQSMMVYGNETERWATSQEL
jgi:hypothetical protein